MKKIPIYSQYGISDYALIDDYDFEVVSKYRWWNDGHGYAQTRIIPGRKGRNEKMHRFILNAPKGTYVDHKNHNTLDNRRENIRLCTQSQNIANGVIRKNNTSGYKGIYFRKDRNKWCAQIMFRRKHIHIGYFEKLRDAIKNYKLVKENYFGEFAL